ncbi:MAG: hypothetical protein BBJ57_01160 [Desulfobacterales bacterium PC51MH44]|nr:MAG: hypothetical protein BBJ57_01160 [Desulfobacterales bacterium PC51MH44]
MTTRLAFGMGVLIDTANDGLPYVAVCMNSIHNYNLSIYPLLKKRVLINCKSGSTPIQGVLQYGERPSGKGLYFCDVKPALNCFISFVASGAQLLLFQFGGGGAYQGANDILLPTSLGVVAPLLWTTANPDAVISSQNSIDFYSGTVLEGKDTIEEAGHKLLELVVDTASGTFTKVETVKHREPAHFGYKDPDF